MNEPKPATGEAGNHTNRISRREALGLGGAAIAAFVGVSELAHLGVPSVDFINGKEEEIVKKFAKYMVNSNESDALALNAARILVRGEENDAALTRQYSNKPDENKPLTPATKSVLTECKAKIQACLGVTGAAQQNAIGELTKYFEAEIEKKVKARPSNPQYEAKYARAIYTAELANVMFHHEAVEMHQRLNEGNKPSFEQLRAMMPSIRIATLGSSKELHGMIESDAFRNLERFTHVVQTQKG